MLLPALAAKDFPHPLDAASADAVRRLPPATAAVREGVRLATAALAVESCTLGVRVSAAQLPGLAALRGEAAAILGIPPADVPELNIRGRGGANAYTLAVEVGGGAAAAAAAAAQPAARRSPRPLGAGSGSIWRPGGAARRAGPDGHCVRADKAAWGLSGEGDGAAMGLPTPPRAPVSDMGGEQETVTLPPGPRQRNGWTRGSPRPPRQRTCGEAWEVPRGGAGLSATSAPRRTRRRSSGRRK